CFESLTTGIASLILCKAVNLQQNWLELIFALLFTVVSLVTAWQEFYTGLELNVQPTGHPVVMAALSAIFAISTAWGAQMWSEDLSEVVPESLAGVSLLQVPMNRSLFILFGIMVFLHLRKCVVKGLGTTQSGLNPSLMLRALTLVAPVSAT
ncbi:hypothetical protein HDU82_003121, partial [Entophlyctis luteolus]